jgi:very-long-chain enoyl-CoA reductase
MRWKHVFYIEHLGPILIMPIFYLLGKRELYTDVQVIALLMVLLHHLKREYEIAYVHVYSRESMPFKRVIINSLHYWVFFALMNSIELFCFPSGHNYSRVTLAVIVSFWIVFEVINYKCHRLMSDFRRPRK